MPQFILKLKEFGINDAKIEKISKNNILQLLNWWKPHKVKAIVKITWICSKYKNSINI